MPLTDSDLAKQTRVNIAALDAPPSPACIANHAKCKSSKSRYPKDTGTGIPAVGAGEGLLYCESASPIPPAALIPLR